MFNKVLIANRGEIAVRIIRACRELGIRTVAVFSEPDRDSLHAKIADEAICIGPSNSQASYLNVKSILAACELSDADAVHPGFGFLSESSSFARKCELCGITFIGPSPDSIDLMGDKIKAKDTMKKAGVPIIPGSDELVNNLDEAKIISNEIGYPVMVKATAGGGGRGIRLVQHEKELENAFLSAKQEALACFGNDGVYIEKFIENPRHIEIQILADRYGNVIHLGERDCSMKQEALACFGNDGVYIEKFIENPRHIEIQILADRYGNVIHLGERDCSMQRKNQKVLEEAPSPFVKEKLRKIMGDAAKKAAIACNYYNAGTVEFLVDRDNKFYFMEMNTRIQVEHPVTEFVTGIDIVKQQILIANGSELEYTQKNISITGHSIECRINAENPILGFRPSPGRVNYIHVPGGPGVRIDSCVYPGYIITPFYDSMIAKLIVYAPTRKEAIIKMKSALAEFLVEGVDTNIDFHLSLLRDINFEKGNYDIGFLNRKLK